MAGPRFRRMARTIMTMKGICWSMYSLVPRVRANPLIIIGIIGNKITTTTSSTTITDVGNCQINLLEQQKQDAIKKFQSVCTMKNISKELQENIIKDLHCGIVPPIFHALTRLSNVNAGNKQLTSAPVSVGSYPSNKDRQPLELDENASNFQEMIDVQGIPRFHIKDRSYMWQLSHTSQAAVCDLVNTKAKMLGYGVEATVLTSNFLVDMTMQESQDMYLLTCSESRGVVAESFKVKNTSAIIGSPGLGKSWTLLYALQQALLYDDKVVLFFECKNNIAFLFYRRNNVIYAWERDHFHKYQRQVICLAELMFLYFMILQRQPLVAVPLLLLGPGS
jgi:hypothetical protein